jgi:hypothetical protein
VHLLLCPVTAFFPHSLALFFPLFPSYTSSFIYIQAKPGLTCRFNRLTVTN